MKKITSVGVVHPTIDTYGGAEMVVLNVARELSKKYAVTFYTHSFKESIVKEFGLKKSQIKILPSRVNPHSSLKWLNAFGLEKHIGKHDIYLTSQFPFNFLKLEPSVCYPHELPRMAYDLAPELMKRKDLNFIVKVGMFLYFPILRFVNKFFNKATVLVANSKFTEKSINKVWEPKKSYVIYPGVEWKAFKPGKKGDYLLVISRLYPEKRIDLAIKVLPHVNKKLKLVIVGSGNVYHEQELKELAKELGVEKRVKMLNGIPFEELRYHYENCFALIFTPIREPLGMAVVEAMAAGKPIIGGNEGGYTELINKHKCGYCVTPEPKKLAEKINKLYSDAITYTRFAKNARAGAKEYTWQKFTEKLEKIFRDITK